MSRQPPCFPGRVLLNTGLCHRKWLFTYLWNVTVHIHVQFQICSVRFTTVRLYLCTFNNSLRFFFYSHYITGLRKRGTIYAIYACLIFMLKVYHLVLDKPTTPRFYPSKKVFYVERRCYFMLSAAKFQSGFFFVPYRCLDVLL